MATASLNLNLKNIDAKFVYMVQIFFFISIIGVILCWINGGNGRIVGLTVITCAMIGLLLYQIHLFSHSGAFWTQLMTKAGPLVFIIALMIWYLMINATYSKYILNKQMPEIWYTFSGLIATTIVIQLIQLYRFMLSMKENKHLEVSTSGVETILMFIVSILFAWLVMIEYIIATYYRTDG